MEEKKLQTPFTVFNSQDELPKEVKDLVAKAKKAVETAYAPYSNFHVGAAVSLANGEVVTGNNQENAAYPSGMCAERVAIWSAASQYPGVVVKTIVITVKSGLKQVTEPISPCGACRQTLLEYEVNQKEPIEIYFMGETGRVIKANSLSDLLPFAFDQSSL